MMKYHSNQNGRDCQLNITIIFFFSFYSRFNLKIIRFGRIKPSDFGHCTQTVGPLAVKLSCFCANCRNLTWPILWILESFDFRCPNIGYIIYLPLIYQLCELFFLQFLYIHLLVSSKEHHNVGRQIPLKWKKKCQRVKSVCLNRSYLLCLDNDAKYFCLGI